MEKITLDLISEKYRKYIIELILSDQSERYLLWGTDLHNEDMDYLLLNASGKIMAFPKIINLLNFIKSTEMPIDDYNSKKWADLYSENSPYAIYDLASTARFLDKVSVIEEYKYESALMVINFCNLFSDYAYQINRSDLINLYEEDNFRSFIDLLNVMFFWDAPNDAYVTELKHKLDITSFLHANETMKKMLYTFEDSIQKI